MTSVHLQLGAHALEVNNAVLGGVSAFLLAFIAFVLCKEFFKFIYQVGAVGQ